VQSGLSQLLKYSLYKFINSLLDDDELLDDESLESLELLLDESVSPWYVNTTTPDIEPSKFERIFDDTVAEYR
jgi:hypothetical protein